jgi:hydroxymethylpyrimidine/phosphomethylpyrimidine kinase
MSGQTSSSAGAAVDAAPRIPRALSIAGSDSGGGAGIQADLKAFAVCGVHGMTAITALTAQNTVGVTAVHGVPPEMILAQVRAVQSDIGVDAVKIGMLGTVVAIRAVAQALRELGAEVPVVLDPVMVSESGAALLEPEAHRELVSALLPRATVITPNLPEARALLAGQRGEPTEGDVEELVRRLHRLGPRVVVVTGGHREQATDVFFDGSSVIELSGERHQTDAAHGSGCTHSSVLAARLAHGDTPLQAARVAKRLASRAVRDGLRELGAGPGPVDVLGLRAANDADPLATRQPGSRRAADAARKSWRL